MTSNSNASSPSPSWESILCALSVPVVLIPALITAIRKPLWFDELLTLHVSLLEPFSAVPTALADGADVQPILGYVLARVSMAIAGESELGLRLPSMIGFTVACCVVYRFTLRRAGPIAAASAALALALTEAFTLAYEARPYGVWLGASALGFLAWTELARGRSRPMTLVLLAASLAAGVSSHYYAVLSFFPIAAGEAARTWRRGRLDYAVWGAMAVGALPLLAHAPLVLEARKIYTGGFWSPAEPMDILGSYIYMLAPLFVPMLVLLLLWGATTKSGEAGAARDRAPLEETAALVALASLPLIAVPLALLVTKAYVYRYSAPALIALSILLGLATGRAGGRRRIVVASALVLLAGFLAVRVAPLLRGPSSVASVSGKLGAVHPGATPVVVTSPHLYAQQQHYSSTPVASRLVYVSDPDWALRELGSNSADLNLTRLHRWAPIRVEDYSGFIQSNSDFLLLHRPGDRFEWITDRLAAEGRTVRALDELGSLRLLRCCE